MSCREEDQKAWQNYGIPTPCMTETDGVAEEAQEPVSPADEPDDTDDGTASGSQADRLVQLALRRYSFHRSPEGEAYCLPLDGPKVARQLRGGAHSLRAELADAYLAKYGKVPSNQAGADAMNVLTGRCQQGETLPTYLRVAPTEGGIALDLGWDDGSCVFVHENGWHRLEHAPEVFRRSKLTMPLPEPEHLGDLDALRTLLNVDDESWSLIVGWLVAAFFPAVPAPILLVEGEQGSAKSWAARLLVRLVDPSAAETRSEPKGLEDWTVAARGSWVVAVDNVSRVPSWWSDALCRAVTGEGLVRRALYTDDDLSVISFRRRIILTAIDAGAMRGDLADRLLRVELERIPEDARREEAELEDLFAAIHPRVLGGLLDLVSSVLTELDSVELERRPRMADFARILAAVDRALGTEALDAYFERTRSIVADVLDADPVGAAISSYIEDVRRWEGSASELLAVLPTPERPPRDWPSTPQAMGGRLSRLAPSLRAAGINVERPGRQKDSRRWLLTLEPEPEGEGKDTSSTSPMSPEALDLRELSEGEVTSSVTSTSDQGEHVTPHVTDVSPGQTGSGDMHDDGDVVFGSLSDGGVRAEECCQGGAVEPRCQVCAESPTYYRRAGA